MSDTMVQEAPVAPSDPKPQPKTAKKRSYKIPRLFFLSLIGICGLVVLGFVLWIGQDLPPLSEIENPQASLSTQVLSSDGVVLDNFYQEENRVNVRLNEISPYVVDALIATEDARFYEHAGVDYMSIPALVKRNISGTTSGGSTITMQLARNLFNAVGRDRTVNRKIKEVVVSAILEKNYTKQEIIEGYLNTVNIYGNAYGIEMASQRLFGKSARFLTIEESAVMVGMLKGQGVFDPIRRPDTVISRRNLVIELMVRHQFLDTAQVNIDSIKALPLVTKDQGREHERGLAPYFRQAVRQFMTDWCEEHQKADGTPYNFYTDGLRVFTTVDSRMQMHAEAAVKDHLSTLQGQFDRHIKGYEPYKAEPEILRDLMRMSDRYRRGKKAGLSHKEIKAQFDEERSMTIFSWDGDIDTVLTPLDSLKYYSRFLETGMVSIDPRTAHVKAWVGGIDFRYFKYDHVALGKRQVGSTFKPFVYAAAIDNGRKPCDQELNQPVVFEDTDGNGTRWAPKNANGKFGGLMTLRRALATSTNLITARLMEQLGPPVVVDYARKAGIRSHLEAVYSLCLGTTDLTVMELTGAYTTFANHGKQQTPIFITRIEDAKGNVLEEFSPMGRVAFNERTAYMMLDLLMGVVDEPGGTAGRLRHDYHFRNEIGAKTGTTQNHADGWFMGVTSNLVSGVWVGCADRRMRFRDLKLGQGASMALPIWAKYMKSVYGDGDLAWEAANFSRPRNYRVDMACDTDFDALMRKRQDANARTQSEDSDLDSFE